MLYSQMIIKNHTTITRYRLIRHTHKPGHLSPLIIPMMVNMVNGRQVPTLISLNEKKIKQKYSYIYL